MALKRKFLLHELHVDFTLFHIIFADSEKERRTSLICCSSFIKSLIGHTCEEFEAYLDSIRFDRLRFSGEEYASGLLEPLDLY